MSGFHEYGFEMDLHIFFTFETFLPFLELKFVSKNLCHKQKLKEFWKKPNSSLLLFCQPLWFCWLLSVAAPAVQVRQRPVWGGLIAPLKPVKPIHKPSINFLQGKRSLWRRSSAQTVPDDRSQFNRFGQWHIKGNIKFLVVIR